MKHYPISMFLVLLLSGCFPLSIAPSPLPNGNIETIASLETHIYPTEQFTATETPAQANCRVNPDQAAHLNPDMVQPSRQSGLCQVTMTVEYVAYSLLFPAEWEVGLLGAPERNPKLGMLGFSPEGSSDPQIFVWGQLTDLPLEQADSAIENDDTLQEKSFQIIGDKQTLVTLSDYNDQTIKRYFILYDSRDKEPRARLYVFEAPIPTIQFDLPESQKRLQAVEAMIASFTFSLP